MSWAVGILIAAVTALLPAGNTLDPERDAELHIWRGEYRTAASLCTDDGMIDRAACLTMSGDLDRAVLLSGGIEDPFRRGLIAYKSGDNGTALSMLGITCENPVLEGYRVYYLARLLERDSLFTQSADECSSFIDLADIDGDVAHHPILRNICDLYITSLLAGGIDAEAEALRLDGRYGLSPAVHLRLAGASPGAGAAARAWLLRAAGAGIPAPSAELYGEIVDRFRDLLDSFSREELLRLADRLVERGMKGRADRMIKHMKDRYPGDPEVLFLRGEYLASIGHEKSAVRQFRSLFESNAAPPAVRKEALLRCAALHYGLGRLSAAVESYRIFGMYYPGDPRADRSLDTAARIELGRGRPEDALELWRSLRERASVSIHARDAALSEAVLRYARGDSAGAHCILRALLPHCGEFLEPAVLYWLCRTAADQAERSRWADSLRDAHPHSCYHRALLDGEESVAVARGAGSGFEISVAEARERTAFSDLPESDLSGSDRAGGGQYEHALDYFLDAGMLGEARECLTSLRDRADGDRLVPLYRKLRSRGMVGLGLTVLDRAAVHRRGVRLARVLHYPVAYAGIVTTQADRYDVPPELLLAVMREESRFDVRAVSRAGALGLMQFMPSTAQWIGGRIGRGEVSIEDVFDPLFSIEAGGWYLSHLLHRSGGSIVGALAAYNAGARRMEGWRKRSDPLERPLAAIEMIGIKETRDYVRRVMSTMYTYRHYAGSVEAVR